MVCPRPYGSSQKPNDFNDAIICITLVHHGIFSIFKKHQGQRPSKLSRYSGFSQLPRVLYNEGALYVVCVTYIGDGIIVQLVECLYFNLPWAVGRVLFLLSMLCRVRKAN